MQALPNPGAKKRTRPRRLGRSSPIRAPSPLSIAPQTPNCFQYLEVVVSSVNDYASGLFGDGNWSWDRFQVMPPAETPNHTSAWQDIADQCFGASTLFVRGNISEGMKTLNLVCEKLREVARSSTPGLLVKFWRIVWYLYKPHQFFGDLRVLFKFLHYFRHLAQIFHPEAHPVFRLLDALVRVREEHLLDTLRVAYRRTIVSMEAHLGETHAIVIHMWSNYLKVWDCNGLAPTILTQRYQILLEDAESQVGPTGENTIVVLHGFLYAAYYNAADHNLAIKLSIALFDKVKAIYCLQERPTWSLAMQGFALAAKVLGTSSKEANQPTECSRYMKYAIITLARGDRECQTRALMLVDLFRGWLLEWDDAGEAAAWEGWKVGLLSTLAGDEADL